MVKVKKTLEMHGWKSLGPGLASLHGPAENIKNIQDHSSLAVQQFTITSIFLRRRLLAEEAELQDSGTTDCALESQRSRSKPCNHILFCILLCKSFLRKTFVRFASKIWFHEIQPCYPQECTFRPRLRTRDRVLRRSLSPRSLDLKLVDLKLLDVKKKPKKSLENLVKLGGAMEVPTFFI